MTDGASDDTAAIVPPAGPRAPFETRLSGASSAREVSDDLLRKLRALSIARRTERGRRGADQSGPIRKRQTKALRTSSGA
jgi:hypothetical protein